MSKVVSPEVLLKVRKLAQLPGEARRSRFAVSTSRLTVLKSLCRQPEVVRRFVTYLAQRTWHRVKTAKRKPYHPKEEWARHREMIGRTVAALENYLKKPSQEKRSDLWMLFNELADEQSEYRWIRGAQVRNIKDSDLLLAEYALRTVLADETSIPLWAYQTARHYAERYDSSHGSGLTPASAPLLRDIVDFWMQEFGLSPESLSTPAKTRKPKHEKLPARPGKHKVRFTHRQGQFLAFIHLYRKLNRQGPAEVDMVQYFQLTPPAVHGMVVRLQQLGLVTGEQGVPRSVRVAISESEIPTLEEVKLLSR
jgi:hypothetical protein